MADSSGNDIDGAVLGGAFRSPGRFQGFFEPPTTASGSGLPIVGLRSAQIAEPATHERLGRGLGARDRPGFGLARLLRRRAVQHDFLVTHLQRRRNARFTYRYGAGVGQTVFAPVPPSVDLWDGEWHLIVGTYDGTLARIYVDDVSQNGQASTFPIRYVAGQGGLQVGDDPGACNGIHAPFKGQLDEVRVYQRALVQTEINYLANEDARVPPRLPIKNDPRFTVRPTLTGSPKVGSTLTCGGYAFGGTAIQNVSFLWESAPRNTKRASSPSWKPIDGAPNAASYVVAPTDAPSSLRCRVIGANVLGTVEAVSNVLRADVDVPKAARRPTDRGRPREEDRLRRPQLLRSHLHVPARRVVELPGLHLCVAARRNGDPRRYGADLHAARAQRRGARVPLPRHRHQ